jgi:alkylation response protein AidB-like acyl-CoA dehydrogenase
MKLASGASAGREGERAANEQPPWLSKARSVATIVTREAAAVERAGTLTPVVVGALREAGLFWMMVPEALGGGGSDLVTGLRVIEEISRADGSTGWTFMANMVGTATACAYVPDAALETMFGNGSRPIFAGMLAPKGTAIRAGDGFLGSGQYQFASGIGHADWVTGGAFVREAGKVVSLESGQPHMIGFFVPRADVTVRGNWDVLGLTGTGSFDFQVPEQFIAHEVTFLLPDPATTRPEPSFQLGLSPTGATGHAAVAFGIAARAFEEVTAIAGSKRRPGMAGISDQQLFLHGFVEKEASLQAARAFFFNVVDDALDTARRDGAVTPLQRQRIRQAVTYGTAVAADVVRWCYTWAGSDGLRNPSLLGRCLRDISAATQHMFVDPNTLVTVAPDLLADWKR